MGVLCGEDTRLLHPAPHQQHQVTPAGDGGASEVPPRPTTGPHPRPGVPCDRDAVLRQETGGVEGRLLLRPVSDAGRRLRDHIGLVEIYIPLSHLYVGSLFLIRCLHLTRSCTSAPGSALSDISFLMLSNHLRFGLLLLLFPGTSIPITLLPTYSSSLLNTCQSTFLDFLGYFSHLRRPLLSFLILSILATPLNHLNFLISATSNFFSCAFFTDPVSEPYIIAGRTIVLYTSPWPSMLYFGHTEPQFFRPNCILCVISILCQCWS